MSVNSLKRTKYEDDEPPIVEDFLDSSIQLLKKNMKIPSSIKLIGQLSDKSFDISKKSAKKEDGPFIKIMYSKTIEYSIIRHSTTGIILRDKLADPKDKDVYYINEIELTMENSYDRDLFALCFKELNKNYLEEISKYDLKEIDFYKRRLQYLEKQMTAN